LNGAGIVDERHRLDEPGIGTVLRVLPRYLWYSDVHAPVYEVVNG